MLDHAEAARLWRTQEGKRLSAQVVSEEPLCRIRLAGCTDISTQADHIIAISVQPALWNVRDNLQGACAWCNNHRQARDLAEMHEPQALSFFNV
jgi:5-methylcytosine-specific restriction endonuclease McrA